MAISIRKYVDITSGVGAGATVRRRDLIGRIISTNPLIPTNSLVEFTDLESVLAYFGSASEEYKRAAFYFSWISKNITRAKKLGFIRWADAATAAQIFGNTTTKALGTFAVITNGAFGISIGGAARSISGVDLSGAASLAAVAALIQAAIRAQSGAQFTSAVVTYDATRKSFNFTSGATGAAVITVSAPSTGTNLLTPLGWNALSTIVSDGADVQTVTDVLNVSTEANNNFGSFLFQPTLDLAEITEAATWNAAQNVLYQYMVPVVKASAEAYFDALSGFQGVAVTVSETANEYPEMVPMTVLAATDFTKRNSVQNYMFQVFNLTPSVTTTADSDTLDPLRANYYGRTQTAGQNLDFYQRGVLMGGITAPVDINVYANEQWLKDACGASIMELLLSLSRVSANAKGRAQLLAQIQSIIDQAVFNGTISLGKPLTQTQKAFITEITGDPDAWRQVNGIGYWIDCVMQSYTTTDGRTEYKAVYTLVYSKDDAIRKVDGTHILI